jgi:hypothetical protein
VTGDNNGDGAMGEDGDDDDNGNKDGAMGSGATGYDDNNNGKGDNVKVFNKGDDCQSEEE